MTSKPKKPSAPADSDLVRLTREIESLKARLEENDKAAKEKYDNIRAAEINYDTARKHNRNQLDHLTRQRKVLEVQLENAKELIAPFLS